MDLAPQKTHEKGTLLPTVQHVIVLVLYTSLHPTGNWGDSTILAGKKRELHPYSSSLQATVENPRHISHSNFPDGKAS